MVFPSDLKKTNYLRMNVIFVTIAYPRTSAESNLNTDLMDEFAEHGHRVYVVCSIEKRFGKATHLTETNGIKVLRVKTGDITSNPNYIAKVLLENNYIGVYRGVKFHIAA